MELAYYHHKVNVQLAEQDTERLKESLEMRKVKENLTLTLALENWKKSAIKFSMKVPHYSIL